MRKMKFLKQSEKECRNSFSNFFQARLNWLSTFLLVVFSFSAISVLVNPLCCKKAINLELNPGNTGYFWIYGNFNVHFLHTRWVVPYF